MSYGEQTGQGIWGDITAHENLEECDSPTESWLLSPSAENRWDILKNNSNRWDIKKIFTRIFS